MITVPMSVATDNVTLQVGISAAYSVVEGDPYEGAHLVYRQVGQLTHKQRRCLSYQKFIPALQILLCYFSISLYHYIPCQLLHI